MTLPDDFRVILVLVHHRGYETWLMYERVETTKPTQLENSSYENSGVVLVRRPSPPRWW